MLQGGNELMRINTVNQNIYNYKNTQKQSSVNFEGLTNNKIYNSIVEKTAESCASIVSTKPVERIFKETKSDNLFTHLIVAGSTLLSGFYIGKTLKNKDMDEKQRKTLALNQSLVYGVSTVMAYTFDGWIKKIYKEKIVDKFMDLHKDAHPDKLKIWDKGFSIARTTMVLGIVYRFIAPVVVTPIANAISNKLHDKKQAQS